MKTLVSRVISDDLFEFVKAWGRTQDPPQNQQQALANILRTFAEQNRAEFEALGILPKRRKNAKITKAL